MSAPLEKGGKFLCSLSTLTTTDCGLSKVFYKEKTIVKVSDCLKSVESHLRKLRLFYSSRLRSLTEAELILCRVGVFSVETELTVCPKHRAELGVCFRPSVLCVNKNHEGPKPKTFRHIGLQQSRNSLTSTGSLIPLGSGVCRKCYGSFTEKEDLQNVKLIESDVNDVSRQPDCASASTFHNAGISEFLCEKTVCEDVSSNSQLSIESDVLVNVIGSQTSNWSTEDGNGLPKLNDFITCTSKVSPIKFKCASNLETCHEGTKGYYVRKLEETLKVISNTIAPGQGQALMDELINKKSNECDKPCAEDTIITLYEEASDSSTRTYLLSILAQKYSKNYLLKTYPILTKFAIDKARKIKAISLHDPSHSSSTNFRQKMDPMKMEHAIEYFSNPAFIQVVAFGSRCLKLENGEKLDIPSVVRTTLHSNLIDMYFKYCNETDFQPLGKTTLYHILNACAASKQKSLKGLDNIAADGSAAFDTLHHIVTCIPKPQDWIEEMCQNLRISKLYLKSVFKVHVSEESESADHCIKWALNDTKSCFKVSCPHSHTVICNQCNLLKTTIKSIQQGLEELENNRDEVEKDFETSVGQVMEWKGHILRTVSQDRCRQDVLDSLKENQAMLVLDWAMKYLPQYYREKQSNWFAQKGNHWHVTVVVHKDANGNLKHRTYTHIMDTVKQDYFAVTSVIEHTLNTMKMQLPSINEVFLRSDNAGCYHSGFLWSVLPDVSRRTGTMIRRYDYSEPQSGKSYCDSKIAHMRLKMRLYVVEKHDIIKASDMKAALDSKCGVAGCQVAVVEVNTSAQNSFTHKFKNISQMHNVEYSDNGDVTVWRAYGIGKGELIERRKYTGTSETEIQSDTYLQVLEDFVSPSKIEGEIKMEKTCNKMNENKKGNVTEANSVEENGLFSCPEEGCSKVYVSATALENHTFIGKHCYAQTESSYDTIKKKWAHICLNLSNASVTDITVCEQKHQGHMNKAELLSMGWALKKERKQNRFTLNVKEYLSAIFEEGRETNRKANPSDVARSMRREKLNGQKRFTVDEWLQPSQILSYFSRLSLQSRQGKNDEKSIKEEKKNPVLDEDLNTLLQEVETNDLRNELYTTFESI